MDNQFTVENEERPHECPPKYLLPAGVYNFDECHPTSLYNGEYHALAIRRLVLGTYTVMVVWAKTHVPLNPLCLLLQKYRCKS